MTSKSPFFIIENFISPLMCEDIIDNTDFNFPDYNNKRQQVKTVRSNRIAESRIDEDIDSLIDGLETYYNFEYKGTLPFQFEWYPEGSSEPEPRCESSKQIGSKWTRINDYCLTGIIFLKDHVEDKNLDIDFEVYGGKLDFPIHNFGILPQRGTLILFPSEQHFINYTNKVVVGDLMQIRFHIASTTPYEYNMRNFPGNHTTWFA